ncbi:MAG: nucleotidyltransferase family protein [Chloroflexota bacterium]
MRLCRQAGQAARAFEAAGIPLIGLKELGLIGDVFPDPGLRPMGDIDLLIHPQDYQAAAGCLAALGFVPLPRPDIPYTRRYAWGHHFRHPQEDIWIDLQWNILQIEWDQFGEGSFDFEIERLWANARPAQVGGERLLVPGLEDMLFHLCLHLDGHRYQELILVCEIAELLRSCAARLDWPRLYALARRYQVEALVAYPLLLAEQLFQAPVPPQALQALRPPYLKSWLTGALYNNLTHLHVALDEIQFAAHPPAAAMRRLEQTARGQAAAAMQLYRRLDQLAAAFVQAGGSYLAFRGAPSERRFPDPALPPFQPLALVILDEDRPAFEQALSACGFAPAPADCTAYRLEVPYLSRDPALDGQPLELAIHCRLAEGPGELPAAPAPLSSRQVALRSLRAARFPDDRRAWQASIELVVAPLAPAGVLAWLAGLAGEPGPDRLYHLIGLADFCLRFPSTAASAEARRTALDPAAGACANPAAVERGLALLDAFFPPGGGQAAGGQAGGACAPPLFHWARLGPLDTEVDAGLKPLYFVALGALLCPEAAPRAAYLLRSLWGGGGPFLPGLAWKALCARLRTALRPPAARQAYWLDPQTGPTKPTA